MGRVKSKQIPVLHWDANQKRAVDYFQENIHMQPVYSYWRWVLELKL
jgi:hypothetical protein